MKAVLRSIKPYWLYCIIIGEKTIEVGKDFPKSDDWNKVVFLYCSQDKKSFNRIPEKDQEWMRKYIGKIACRFVCDRISEFSGENAIYHTVGTCLTPSEIADYIGEKYAYYWHISDLAIYDKPRELGEFKCAEYHYGRIHLPPRDIARPPQSWMYVESEDNK
jgi:predicted transcriptional regulator